MGAKIDHFKALLMGAIIGLGGFLFWKFVFHASLDQSYPAFWLFSIFTFLCVEYSEYHHCELDDMKDREEKRYAHHKSKTRHKKKK